MTVTQLAARGKVSSVLCEDVVAAAISTAPSIATKLLSLSYGH